MAGCLFTALYPVGEDDGDPAAPVGKLAEGRHSDGIPETLQRLLFKFFLRDAWWISNRHTRDEHIGVIREICAHCSVSVFKIKLHIIFSLYAEIQFNYLKIFLGVEPDLTGETGECDQSAVDFIN